MKTLLRRHPALFTTLLVNCFAAVCGIAPAGAADKPAFDLFHGSLRPLR